MTKLVVLFQQNPLISEVILFIMQWIELMKVKTYQWTSEPFQACKHVLTVWHDPLRVQCLFSMDAVITAGCGIIYQQVQMRGLEFSILASEIRPENIPVRKELQGMTQPALTDWSKCWSTACVQLVMKKGYLLAQYNFNVFPCVTIHNDY